MSKLWPTFCLLCFALPVGTASAQFGQPTPTDQEPLPESTTQAETTGTLQRVRIGLKVRAGGGACSGLFATMPAPLDWPEQEVRIVDETSTQFVRSVNYRTTYDAAKQMLVSIPQLPAGESADALTTFEIIRHPILPPEDPSEFVIPQRRDLSRDMQRYLSESPFIEIRHREIRDAAEEIGGEDLPAWEQAELIYDWVREHVEYTNGPLKGALAALRDGTGDCEELTSLFIAICRIRQIPARTVWVTGHCYPEFYLHDAAGEGHWIPCQAAGDRQFGEMYETRVILQKGDNFRVPEKREAQRYIAHFLRGNAGAVQPEVQFVQENVPLEE